MDKINLSKWIKYIHSNGERGYIRTAQVFNKNIYPYKNHIVVSEIIKLSPIKWSCKVRIDGLESESWHKEIAPSLEEAVFLSDLIAQNNGYYISKPFFL